MIGQDVIVSLGVVLVIFLVAAGLAEVVQRLMDLPEDR